MDSFQNEIPKSRINITLEVETGGVRKKKELPLKLLVLGNFSNHSSQQPIAYRERISVTKADIDSVIQTLSPQLQYNISRTDQQAEHTIQLQFKSLKDFHPENITRQVPALKKLLAMRNLLKELKANVIDNQNFRKELENIIKNPEEFHQLQTELSHNHEGNEYEHV